MYTNNKNRHYRIGKCIIENVLTKGKNIDKPRINRFLGEFRFIYCNADRPKRNCKNMSKIIMKSFLLR